MLSVSLVTLGPPTQLTGGYLYHQRLADAAPEHAARLEFVAVPMLPFPLPTLFGPSVLGRAAREGEVIVVDSIAAAFVGPAAAVRLPARPVVAMVHQPPGGIDHSPARTRVQAALDSALYRRVALIIAASQPLADDFEARGFAGKVEVVPPGADLAAPPSGPLPDLRQGRRAAFLSVGNWVPRKGTLALLDAFSRLPADAATLHLVGRGDVEPTYATQVERRLGTGDLAGRVVVHGPLPRPQVATLYRGADAFVLPSEREPYGTVYGEALAAGLPVVGWRAGNLPHLARDGVEGVILPLGDVAGLAQALERLATDEPWRHSLAQGARRRGRSLPTWSQSAGRFYALLTEVRDQARTAG